jgi:carbon starvation protein CstA
MISLWVATSYLLQNGKKQIKSLITALPATFMSAVSMTYILMAEEGLRLNAGIAYPAGIGFAAILFAFYLVKLFQGKRK